MKVTNEFLIPFAGLKLGKHQFEFDIKPSFFEHFNYEEFQDASIKVSLVLEKKTTMLQLNFKHQGTVHVACDLTNEDFDLPIKGELELLVKFGEAFNNDDDELLVLPHGEFQVDVSQYIYEMIVLSVPNKRIHPGVKDGSLQSDILTKLEDLQVQKPQDDKKDNEPIDPRWEELKKLLNDK